MTHVRDGAGCWLDSALIGITPHSSAGNAQMNRQDAKDAKNSNCILNSRRPWRFGGSN
jgi:hypothetical protein